MSYIILRLDGTKEAVGEAVGIAEIPNDPKQARVITQFNVFHREMETISANWISQSEYETYKVLELFPEFGCCYRTDGPISTIGVYDPVFFYLENNRVRARSTDVERYPNELPVQPQYSHFIAYR